MSEVIIKVPSELFAPAESSFFQGDYELTALVAGPDEYRFEKPLKWQVSVTNTGEALLVTGTVEGLAEVACGRCLTECAFDIAGEIEGYFLFSEDSEAPEDLDEDEFQVLGSDNTIDLEPLIKAAILLEFPYIPLCNQDCKGLCPHCGVDRNKETCSCEPETPDEDENNPFSVLKDLL